MHGEIFIDYMLEFIGCLRSMSKFLTFSEDSPVLEIGMYASHVEALDEVAGPGVDAFAAPKCRQLDG